MRVSCVSGVGFGGGERGYRQSRRKTFNKKKVKDLELSVKILIEEGLPNDPEILVIFLQFLVAVLMQFVKLYKFLDWVIYI